MTAPANRWKLGLFVVAGLAAGTAGLTWLGMRELRKSFQVAYAYFDEAVTGLEEGSPVKFRGVTIGVVDEIRAAPDKRHLEVRAALYDDKLRKLGLDAGALGPGCTLPENLRAQLVMSWVTSTSFVQVDFFPDPPTGPQQLPFPVAADRPMLRTVPSTAKSLEDASREVFRELPLVAGSVRELVELLRGELQGAQFAELSRTAQAVLLRFDRLLLDAERRGLVEAGTEALAALRSAAASVDDPRTGPGAAVAELRGALQQLRSDLAAAGLPATTAALRGAALSAQELGDGLGGQLAQLRGTLQSIERLMAALERDPGALLYGRQAVPSPLEGRK
jgi:paraquat-inducible protein B